MTKKFSIILSSVLIVFGVCFSSCQVGLGEAVDTQPPKLEIEYPPTNSVIRQAFMVEGSASDETSLNSVILSFQNIDDKTKDPVEFTATLNAINTLTGTKHSWACEVDPFGTNDESKKLIDGRYEMTVTAYDNAVPTKRSTQKSRTYIIDNTAPLLLIENPSTIEDSTSINKFGQNLKVVGRVSDSNDVDYLLFNVYDYESKKLVSSAHSDGIAQNMEITLGTWSDTSRGLDGSSNSASEEEKFYKDVYDSTTSDTNTKNFRFKITISDEARRYPGQKSKSSDSERGNTTEEYYIYKNIYTPVLKKFDINVKQLYNVLNGTFGNPELEKEILKVLSTLKVESDFTDDNPKGTFALNPYDYPYYTVSGINALKDLSFEEVSKSHVLTINAYKGVGETPLDSKSYSLRLYLIDEFGKFITNDGKKIDKLPAKHEERDNLKFVTAFESYDDLLQKKEAGELDEAAFNAAVEERNTIVDENNNQVTVLLSKIADKLETNQHYEIILDGHDEDSNDFENEGSRYCFKIKADGTAPTIKVTSPVDSTLYIQSNNAASISGTVLNVNSDSTWVYAYINGDGLDSDGLEVDTSKRIYAKGHNSGTEVIKNSDVWEISIPESYFAAGTSEWTSSELFSIKIFAKDYNVESSNASTVDKYVYCDVQSPSVTLMVSPTVTYDEAGYGFLLNQEYANSTITVSGSVSDDSNISDTSLVVYKSDTNDEESVWTIYEDTSSAIKKKSTSFIKPVYTVDTTKLADGENKYFKFKLISRDQAGNSNETDSDYKVILVNQETDKPAVNLSNADKTIKTAEEVKANSNLFDQTGNNKILGTVRDDDGLQSITAWYKTAADGEYTEKFYSTALKGQTSATLSIPFKTKKALKEEVFAEGIYFIKIQIEDITVTKDNRDTSTGISTYEFCIGVDSGAPSLTIDSTSNSYAKPNNENYTVAGKAKDSSGIVKIYRSLEKAFNEDSAVLVQSISSTAETNWTDKFTTSTEGQTLYYTAVDKYGNYTTSEFIYNIDIIPPTAAPDWATGFTDGWTKNNSYKFSVPVSDSWNVSESSVLSASSGVNSVVLRVTKEGGSSEDITMVLGTPYDENKYENQYYYYNTTQMLEDGKFSLKVTVTDVAENSTIAAVYNQFWVDTVEPVVGAITAKLGEDEVSSLKGSDVTALSLASKPFVISATAQDALSGIKSVKLYDNDELVAPEKYELETIEGTPVTYKFRLKSGALLTGNHTYKIVAEDNASNTKETAVKSISIDATEPVVTVNGVSPTVAEESVTYINSHIKVTGTATDETKLGKDNALTWKICQAGDTTPVLSGTLSLTPKTYSSWTIENISTEALADGDYELYASAVDAAGNKGESAAYELKVKHSTDKPVVVVTNADSNVKAHEITAQNNLFGVASNNKLAISITDDKGLSNSVNVSAYAVTVSGSTATVSPSAAKSQDISLGTSGKTSANVNFTLPDTEGVYQIVITVKDQEWAAAGETAKANHTNDTSVVYNIAVDAGAPIFTISTTNNSFAGSKVAKAITGKVQDSSGNVTIYRSKVTPFDVATSTAIGPAINASEEKSWNDTFETDEFDEDKTDWYCIYYTAVDKYDNYTTIEFRYDIDQIDPTVAPDWTDASAPGGWTKNNTYKFIIPVSDNWNIVKNTKINGSGIQSLVISGTKDGSPIASENFTLGTPYNDSKFEGQYFNWTLTKVFEQGKYNLTVTASDVAGNSAVVATYPNFWVDAVVPTVSTPIAKLNGAAVSQLSLNDIDGKQFELTSAVNDVTSKIHTISLMDSETEVSTDNYTIGSSTVTSGNIAADAGKKSYNITTDRSENNFNLVLKKPALTTGTHSFKIKAVDNAGNSFVSNAVVIVIDATAPVVNVNGISPVVSDGVNTYVNSYIKITGSAVDETKLKNTNGLTYKIFDSSDAEISTGTLNLADSTYFAWTTPEVSTENLVNGQTYKIIAYAQDASNNQGQSAPFSFIVNHETDKPVVTVTNAASNKEGVTSAANISIGTNLFGTTSNNKLSITVTDDKGLASPVTITVKKNSDGSVVDTFDQAVTEGKTSATVSYTLPETEGVYRVSITAKDQEWGTAASAAKVNHTNDSTVEYFVAVDAGAPAFEITTESGVYQQYDDLTISGTVSDACGKVTIYRYDTLADYKSSQNGVVVKTIDSGAETTKGWSETIAKAKVNSDGGNFWYQAVDVYGNSKGIVFNYLIDARAPTIVSGWTDSTYSPNVNGWLSNNTFKFSIPLSDGWDTTENKALASMSGISSVTLNITNPDSSKTTERFAIGSTYGSNNYYNYYNLTKSFDVDGKYSLTVDAEDAAGNKAVNLYSYANFWVDHIKPVVSAISVKKNGAEITSLTKADITDISTKPLFISAEISDATSGIETVKLYDNEDLIEDSQYTLTESAGVYTFKFTSAGSALSTGNHSFIIKAKDNAGNESATEPKLISIDQTEPTVSINGISPLADAVYVTSFVNVSGVAQDETLLSTADALRWEIRSGSSTGTVVLSGTTDLEAKIYKTWTVSSINTESLADGGYVFIAYATDDAGNEGHSSPFALTVNHSADKPVVTVTNASVIGSANDVTATTNLFGTTSNNKLAITVTDDKGLATPVTVTAYPAAGGEAVDTKALTVSAGKTSANVNYVLPSEEGKYKIVISANDQEYAGAESGNKVNHQNDTSIVYYVGVDAGNPKFSFTTVSGSYKPYAAFTVEGKVQDSSGTVTVKRYNYTNKKDGEKASSPAWTHAISSTGTEKSWTDTIAIGDISDTGGNFYYIAEDAYGNTTDLIFNYKIDQISPTVAPDFNWTGGSASWSNRTTYTYKIPVSDAWDKVGGKKYDESSGIQSVTILVKGDGESEFTGSIMSLGSVYKGASGTVESYLGGNYFNYTSTQQLSDGGSTQVKFEILDNAGNKYTSDVLTYKIDSTAPEFGEATVTPSGITSTEYNSYTGANIYTIVLPVNETGSGVKSITIDDNKKPLDPLDEVSSIEDAAAGYIITPAVTEGAVSPTYTIKFTKAAVVTGQHTFNINVTDVAGNVSTFSQMLSSDSTPPVIDISGITPVYDANTMTVNGDITVKGFVSDDARLASLVGTNPAYTDGPVTWKLYKTTNLTTPVKSGVVSTVNGGISAAWSVVVETAAITDGDYKFVITAKDAAGNVSSKDTSFTVDQNTDKPRIKLTSASENYTTPESIIADTNNTNVLAQGAKLAGLIEDDDGIKTVKVGYRIYNTGSYTESTLVSDGESTTYSLNYTLPSDEGAYDIKIYVEDTAGNATYGNVTSTFCVAIDAGSPEWTDFSPANGTYNNGNISVSSTVSDGSGEISVKATTIPSGATSTHGSTPWTVSASSGLFTDTVGIDSLADKTTDGGYTVIYTATDKWGQTSTRQFSFYKDATSPQWIDANSKVGDVFERDTVGASWFKSEALTVEGQLTETGSGVQTIYYWVKRNKDAAVTVSTDTATATGSFAAKNASGVASYKAAIDNILNYINEDPSNSNQPTWSVLYLVAEDAAGNKSVYNYEVKVDTNAPDVAGGSSSTILTNKITDLVVEGTCSDTQSGVKSVTLNVGSNEISATVNAGKWSATVPVAKIVTGNIYATAIDNAGNKTSAAVGAIQVDATAPVVSFDKSAIIAYQSGVNGKKAVDGAVTETNPAKLELWYNKAATPTVAAGDALTTKGWTKFYETTASSEIYNFTTSNADGTTYQKLLDFDTASGAKDVKAGTGTLYILPVVYDTAGNCSVHGTNPTPDFTKVASFAVKFVVDMNSDRPIVRMNELEGASGTIRKYTTNITGMINDDDGVKEFYISPDVMANEAAWNTYIASFKAKTSAEQNKILEWTSNGSFMYTPENGDDGTHELYFYVKDNENNVFFTSKTTSPGADVYRPYVQYKNSSVKNDNNAVVSYKTDSNPPTVEGNGYCYAAYTNASVKGNTAAGTYSSWTNEIPSTILLGGTNHAYVKFRIIPHDVLGVGSVSGSIGSTPLNFTKGDAVLNGGTPTGDYYYVSDPVDLGNLSNYPEEGSYTLNIVVRDISDLTATMQRSITIDNKAPTVAVSYPTQMVTDVFSVRGTSSDSHAVTSLKYLVMNDENLIKTDAQLISIINANTTQHNEGVETAFEFPFDNNSACDEHPGCVNPKFPATSSALIAYANSKQGDTDLYRIPVYFLAEDELGNKILFKDYKVYFNPYSDRPTITAILSPMQDEVVSGMIRISGAAEDNTAVDSVYIQIDCNKDGNFAAADMVYLLSKGYEVSAVSSIVNNASYKTYKDSNKLKLLDTVGGNAPNVESDSGFWGIKCSGQGSWYSLVNSSNNLQNDSNKNAKVNPTDDQTYTLSVRAAAIDEHNTLGSWSDKRDFVINPNAPSFGGSYAPRVVQYSDSALSVENASYDYSSMQNTYVNGVWYLVTSVEHSNGVNTVNYDLNGAGGEPLIVDGSAAAGKANQVKSITNGWIIKIPVTEGSGEGTVNLTITAAETGGKTSTASYSVNYDNQAPEIDMDSLTANEGKWTSSTKLMNSNNSLTIGATVNDGKAGMGKVLFYFYRNYGGVKRIFDVGMNIKDQNGDYTYSFTKDTKTYAGIDASSVNSINLGTTENLYGLEVTVTRPSSTSITLPYDNAHIRKGGYVRLGNIWHKITNKVDKTLTITPGCAESNTTAFFSYAMAVDNFNPERIRSFTLDGANINGDDGDGMWESIGGGTESRQWTASIHANWIPDGPVTCVMFAFDNANNVSAVHIDSTLETSGPRLAKVHLGTDLNKNNSYSTNEFETYNFLGVEGEYQDAMALFTKQYKDVIGGTATVSQRGAFKIKNKLAVIPEFVGGNGDIYCVFNNNDSTTTLVEEAGRQLIDVPGYVSCSTYDTTGACGAGKLNPHTGTISDADTALNGAKYWEFKNDLGSDSSSETDYKKMSFTFWDSTDSLEVGSTSQKCFLSVQDFLVMQADTIAPKAVTEPFYWKSANDNSLYKNSAKNGHIELEDDLPAAIITSLGLDPKVSGKVVFHGTAYDETFLSKLSFSFTNFGSSTTTPLVFATYNQGTNKWAPASATIGDDGYEFVSATDVYFGQKGHKVEWAVAVDTAKISDVAHKDAVFTVYATDAATGAAGTPHVSSTTVNTSSKDDSVYNKPGYGVDVVPYITGVYRNKRFNTNRARSGATPLLRGEEENKITGFNIATTTNSSLKVTPDKAGTGTAVSMTSLAVSGNDLTFTMPNTANSGYLQLVVNNVKALNNINAYTEYNEEENAKAFDHNTISDDRYTLVWRVTSDDTFKGSKNAVYPAMSKNPNDGVLYASFTNYGQSKTYYTNQFTGNTAVGVSTNVGNNGANITTDGVSTVFNGYDPPEMTDLSVGSDGQVNVFYAANYHGGNDGNWSGTGSTDAGGIYIYDANAGLVDCSRSSHNIWRSELFTYDNELNQFKNLRINRVVKNNFPYSNVVYYDRLTNAVKFGFVANELSYTARTNNVAFTYNASMSIYTGTRYFRTQSTVRDIYTTTNTTTNYDGNYVMINGSYIKINRNTYYTSNNTNTESYYYTLDYSGKANFTSNVYTATTSAPNTSNYGMSWVTLDGSYDSVDNGGTGFTFATTWKPFILTDARYSGVSRASGTGESIALTANNNGYAVVLYMDADSGQLRIARANSLTPNAVTNWTVQGVFASSDENYDTASDYMSCAVDSSGYLHIAFQNTKGQLVYAKSTNAPSDGNTAYTFGSSEVLDDSGMWIDMTMDGNTPYISYLSRVNSYDGMKVAFKDSSFDEDNDGIAETDGGWETMTAPLNAKVTNVRTCVEVNAKAQDSNQYKAAIGFCPGADYRAAFFTGK